MPPKRRRHVSAAAARIRLRADYDRGITHDGVRFKLQPLVDSPRDLLFIVIMTFTMVVGMVMDLTPTVLILTPVLLPLVKRSHY